MIVFITGIDGLLGSNLTRELLSRGHEVRGLVEIGRTTEPLDGLDVEIFRGNILDEQSLGTFCKGVDAVVHTAASTTISPARSTVIRDVNITGTGNIIQAVLEVGVKRFIHVGTANTFRPGSKEQPGIEDTPYTFGEYGLDYMDSKKVAHDLVLEAVHQQQLPAIIVNPTFMIGPFDRGNSSGALLLALYNKSIPGYTAGGRNYVPVKDVAAAISNALEKGSIGEAYILGGSNLNYHEIFETMSAIIGVKAPKLKLPKGLVLSIAALSTYWGKLTGKDMKITLPVARMSCDQHYYSSAKATQELDMPHTSLETAINECFLWMKNHDVI